MPDLAVTESRCRHDLLLITCIWCTPRPGIVDLTDALQEHEPRTTERAPRWADASRWATCDRCDTEIRPGDTIRLIGRQAVCKDCGETE